MRRSFIETEKWVEIGFLYTFIIFDNKKKEEYFNELEFTKVTILQ
jgi:hypothetical protein